MSIPRIAIERPVTMFMISMVIILLGGISLTRLPVDLMPDTQMPTITVRVNYSGVGPLEMEELVTRPIEQAVSAVAGLERVDSTSSEGSANVRLNFAWGTDLSEAADEVRTRLDRVRGRMPEDADPPTVFKFDSTAMPIMGIGVEGDFDPVTLREIAQNDLSPRLERVAGVAAVTINGGLRRQIHVDLSREKITALNLSPDRIVQILRTENQNIPLGEINDADRTLLLRSPGQFTNIDEIKNIVVMTRDGVPVYMRDIADVTDTTEDRRSFMRINGANGIRMQVTKQSGTNTIQIAEGVKKEVERINADDPGHQAADPRRPVAVHRARDRQRARSTPCSAACWSIAIILPVPARPQVDVDHLHVDPGVGDRHLRAALLRRLHAQHADLRRPGARHRHDRRRRDRRAREHLSPSRDGQGPHHRGDRRQRRSVVGDSGVDADAHRGVRADAVPDRRVEHHVRPARRGGVVLAGDVAAGRGDDRAGAVLAPARSAARAARPAPACWRGSTARSTAGSTTSTSSTRACCTCALAHRPTVFAHRLRAVRGRDVPAAADRLRIPAADRRRRDHGRRRAGGRLAHRAHRGRADRPRGQDSRGRAGSDDADHAGQRRRWWRRLRRRLDAPRQRQRPPGAARRARRAPTNRSRCSCAASCRAFPA